MTNSLLQRLEDSIDFKTVDAVAGLFAAVCSHPIGALLSGDDATHSLMPGRAPPPLLGHASMPCAGSDAESASVSSAVKDLEDLAAALHLHASEMRAAITAKQSGLDALPSALFFVDAVGRIRCANQEARNACGRNDKVGVHADVLRFHDRAAQQSFVAALDGLREDVSRSARRALCVFRLGGDPTWIVIVSRIPNPSIPRKANVASVVLYEEARSPLPNLQTWHRRHRLSRAEAKVLSLLVAGKSVNEIAFLHNRTLSTTRQHVKHVMAKTGIARQSELVRRIWRERSGMLLNNDR